MGGAGTNESLVAIIVHCCRRYQHKFRICIIMFVVAFVPPVVVAVSVACKLVNESDGLL